MYVCCISEANPDSGWKTREEEDTKGPSEEENNIHKTVRQCNDDWWQAKGAAFIPGISSIGNGITDDNDRWTPTQHLRTLMCGGERYEMSTKESIWESSLEEGQISSWRKRSQWTIVLDMLEISRFYIHNLIPRATFSKLCLKTGFAWLWAFRYGRTFVYRNFQVSYQEQISL